MSVAAREVGGGAVLHGDARPFVTASVVKAGILAALLLQARAAGRELDEEERAHAAAMIERSDNEAASALWRTIGGRTGLDRAARTLGLPRTEGGPGGYWGLTRTTAADQLTLLQSLYGTAPSPLDGPARAYVQERLARVVEDQRWGVSAAGEAVGLKNGWMPRDATGLWVVHSVGRVTAGGRPVLLAVLSEGHATKADGVAAVERAARAAVRALAG
ncbi:serine hydrolase [Streptomyces sp. NPDC048172]|uniref:serine hydrolase n=1 Tax=Streptomyces sp. NPDC048172 TaxID=3365505 RepID=UPI00371C7AE7